jgi:dethiobiotin synthetase
MPANDGWRGLVLVTGTDTGVGKTITTAAIAATAAAGGLRVAVMKPGQTGIGPGNYDEPDIDTIARLAAPDTTRTVASYPDPLAPAAAARVSCEPPLRLETVTAAARELAATHDLVLIEGAGGLLVPMGPAPEHNGPEQASSWTVADLAVRLSARAVVVARAGLGTLNHTALTLEALWRRGIEALVVIGEWPAHPEMVHRMNASDLPGDLAGVITEAAGRMSPEAFRAQAPQWLAPALHGHLNPARWRRSGRG